MAIKLDNIDSISPDGTGQVVVSSDVNLVGSPAPVYRVNGVPLATGQNQTPWTSNIDGAGYSLLNPGQIRVGSVTGPSLTMYTTAINWRANNIGRWALGKVGAGDNLLVSRSPGDSDSSTDTVLIDRATGYVGLANSSPAYQLDVAGDVNATGQYRINGVPLATGGVPAGSDGQIQFNNNGAFGASSVLTWDDANVRLNVGPQVSATITYGPSPIAFLSYADTQSLVESQTRIGLGVANNATATGNYASIGFYGVNSGATPSYHCAAMITAKTANRNASGINANLVFATRPGTADPLREAMRVSSGGAVSVPNGPVLIGTSAVPSNTNLYVMGSNNALVSNGDAIINCDSVLGSTNLRLGTRGPASDKPDIAIPPQIAFMWAGFQRPLCIFATGSIGNSGIEAIRVMPETAYVGIGGVTNPAYPLDVAGDVNLSAGSVYRINGVPLASGGTPAGADGQIQFNNNGNFGASPLLTWNNTSAALSVGYPWMMSAGLNLKGNAGPAQNSQFPNFGILAMHDGSGSNGLLFGIEDLGAGDNTAWIRSYSTMGGQTYMVLQPNGALYNHNVGIGKTPAWNYKLDVAGDVNLSAGSVYRINGVAIGTGGASQWTDVSGGIAYTGNVGIGAGSSPQANLHVVDLTNSGGPLLRLAAGSGGGSYFDFSRNNGTGALSIQGNQTTYNNIVLAPTSGNVGIGTASPWAQLHVKVGTGADSSDQPAGPWAAVVHNSVNGANWNGLLVKNTWAASNSTVFQAGVDFAGGAFNPYFIIRGDGRVGIGTTNPARRLVVSADAGTGGGAFYGGIPSLRVDGTGPYSEPSIEFTNSQYGEVPIATITGKDAGDGALIFATRNAGAPQERMRIHSNRFVGIGMASQPQNVADPLTVGDLGNGGQIRMVFGGYGAIMRNDDVSFHLLVTNQGDPGGAFNGLRPFNFDLNTGAVNIGHGLSVGGNVNITGNFMVNGVPITSWWGGVVEQIGLQANGGAITQTSAARPTINLSGGSGVQVNSQGMSAAGGGWSVLNTSPSDLRLKENIRDLTDEDGLPVINQVRCTRAEFNGLARTNKGESTVSAVAQEIQKIIPESVYPYDALMNPEDEDYVQLLSLNSVAVLFHAVKAIQQLDRRLSDLQSALQEKL